MGRRRDGTGPFKRRDKLQTVAETMEWHPYSIVVDSETPCARFREAVGGGVSRRESVGVEEADTGGNHRSSTSVFPRV